MSKKSLYTAAALSVMSLCGGETSFAGKELDCTALTQNCIARANTPDPTTVLTACSQFTQPRREPVGVSAEEACKPPSNLGTDVMAYAVSSPKKRAEMLSEMQKMMRDRCKTSCKIKLQEAGHCHSAKPCPS